jgi:predicted GH43/DUF377 family glycosyl hydrolase
VLGNEKLGTCFDLIVFPKYGNNIVPQNTGEKSEGYKMYFSWRPKSSLAVTTSPDGIKWEDPKIILAPNPVSGWEDNLNRFTIVQKDGKFHMWYTGQYHDNTYSAIGYATATDDMNWVRVGNEPVMVSERPFEGMSVMLPSVLWDEEQKIFKMWYSAGETYEPNVICYATSFDGFNWHKYKGNPIFVPAKKNAYEKERVGGCQIIRYKGGYLMFYIGYEDIDTARICGAWSPDGISRWKRFDANPLVSPTPDSWDGDACYKPGVLYDEVNKRWLLWYNGRHGAPEYIGLVIHEGEDLGV